MLSHFGLSDDETKILTGFPMHKINNVDTMEKKGLYLRNYPSLSPALSTPHGYIALIFDILLVHS